MTAGAVGFSRLRFLGLTAIAAVSWAFYSVAIGIGAGAWLGDRPVVAVLVGVVGGAVIGLAVDAVLTRVPGRPRVRRLRADRAPGAEPRADGSPEPGPPAGPGSLPLHLPLGMPHDLPHDLPRSEDAARDDVILVTGGGARRPAAAVLLPRAELP